MSTQLTTTPPPATAAPGSLTGAAIQGMKWTTMATLATSVLQVGYTAVMARLLTPADFGLVALAAIFMRFGGYFAQMGMEQALIQKATLTTADVRAAFTSAVGLGLFFASLLWLLAPLGGRAFSQPGVVPIIHAMSVGLVLMGIYATSVSLLRRQMRFRTLAIMEVSTFVLSYGGVGVTMAWLGYGAWSLVGTQLCQSLLLLILGYAVTRHSIKPLFSWQVYRPLVQYGGWSSVASFCEYMTGELDKMAISRLWGGAALGLYSRAAMLIALPAYTLTASVTRVALPSFSQVQDDRPRLRGAYLRSVVLTGVLIMPLCLGAAVAAPELVRVMLGPQWMDAVPIFRVICLLYSLSTMNMFAVTVCDATANLTRKLVLTLTHAASLLALFVLLRGFGLVGIALAVLLGEVLRTVFYLILMRQVLTVELTTLARSYVPPLLLGAGVAAAIALVASALRAAMAPLPLVFAAEMLTGAISLPCLILLLPLPALQAEVAYLLGHLNTRAGPVVGPMLAWLHRQLLPTSLPA